MENVKFVDKDIVKEIANLNEQIRLLQEQREKIHNSFKEILSLNWTRECFANLKVNSGTRDCKYVLEISGNRPKVDKDVILMGEHNDPYLNIVYNKNGYIETNSHKLICVFLDKVTFKSLDFDRNHYQVLNFVNNKIKTYAEINDEVNAKEFHDMMKDF